MPSRKLGGTIGLLGLGVGATAVAMHRFSTQLSAGSCFVAQQALRPTSNGKDAWASGSSCEILRVKPEQSKLGALADQGRGSEGTILVLPGNPGVPGYYRRFAEGVAETLGTEVVILGYCGHTLVPRVAPWQVFSLQDQIEHVVGYIDNVHGDGELRIIGHSIGAYIALEAMRRRPKTVSHVLGLTPFLENNDANPSFARMAFLALLPAPVFWPALGTLCLVMALVKLLPFKLRRMLAGSQTGGFDSEWVDFTANAMLQPGVFANYAYMGRTELRHHARPYDFVAHLGAAAEAGSKDLTKRVRLLYTDQDFWAPEAYVPAAQAAGIQAEVHKGMGHQIPVRSESCDWAADWSSRQLRELGNHCV